MSSEQVHVSVIYPADPAGDKIPGGIDPFIRGLINWAPDSLTFELIGVTTDSDLRPVGRWTRCALSKKRFDFFPVLALDRPSHQSLIPLSLKFIAGIAYRKPKIRGNILDFHRIEPTVISFNDTRPKNLFVHQNTELLTNKHSSVRWRFFPQLFYKMEEKLIPKLSTIYLVREQAVSEYRDRFPLMTERLKFCPTWYDPEIFFPIDERRKIATRQHIITKYALPSTDALLVSVGRLDAEKNPDLLLNSFLETLKRFPKTSLIIIGDGRLREHIAERIGGQEFGGRVKLAGMLSSIEVAQHLQVASALILSSAYEGMPICVLEALACGIPAISTKVGEVPRLIIAGQSGEVAESQTSGSLAAATARYLEQPKNYHADICREAASPFTPQNVLKPIYTRYMELC